MYAYTHFPGLRIHAFPCPTHTRISLSYAYTRFPDLRIHVFPCPTATRVERTTPNAPTRGDPRTRATSSTQTPNLCSCDAIDKLKGVCQSLDSELSDPAKFRDFYQFTFNYAKITAQKGLGWWSILCQLFLRPDVHILSIALYLIICSTANKCN